MKRILMLILICTLVLGSFAVVAENKSLTQEQGLVLEAEDAEKMGEAAFYDNHLGYSGKGFMALPPVPGTGLLFTFESDFEGQILIAIGYANGMGNDQRIRLFVNDVLKKFAYLNLTGGWDKYGVYREIIDVHKGTNTITLDVGDAVEYGGVNIDYIIVGNAKIDDFTTSKPDPEKPQGEKDKYEAEDANLIDGTSVANNHAGFSGNGFVMNVNPGTQIEFLLKGFKFGTYALTVGYANGHGVARTISLYTNGTKDDQLQFPSTGGWANYGTIDCEIELKAGNNILSLKVDPEDDGQINVDYIIVKPLDVYSGDVVENLNSKVELLVSMGLLTKEQCTSEEVVMKKDFIDIWTKLAGAPFGTENVTAVGTDLVGENYQNKEMTIGNAIEIIGKSLGLDVLITTTRLDYFKNNKIVSQNTDINEKLTYKKAAEIIFASANAKMGVFIFNQNNHKDLRNVTALEYFHDIYKKSGIVNSEEKTSLWGRPTVGANEIQIGNEKFAIGRINKGEFLGFNVEIYYKKQENEIVSIMKTDKNIQFKIYGDEIQNVGVGKISFDKDGKAKNATFIGTIFYNGSLIDAETFKTLSFDYIDLLDNNNDGKFEITKGYKFLSKKVLGLDLKNSTIYYDGGNIVLDEDVVVHAKMKEIKYNSIISIAYDISGKVNEIFISNNIVKGKVEKISLGKVTVDGKTLKTDLKFKLGENVTVYTDVTNKIVFSQNEDYLYQYGIIKSVETFKETADSFKIKLYDQSGKFSIFTFKNKLVINGVSMKLTSDILDTIKQNENQLIKYKLSSGQISEIIFLDNSTNFKELTQGFGLYRYKVQQNGFEIGGVYSSTMILRGDVIVFNLMRDSQTNEIISEKSSVTNIGVFGHDQVYNIRVFDIDSLGMARVVIRERKSNEYNAVGEIFVCKSIEQQADKDGNIFNAAKGYYMGKEVTYEYLDGVSMLENEAYLIYKNEDGAIGYVRQLNEYKGVNFGFHSLGGAHSGIIGEVKFKEKEGLLITVTGTDLHTIKAGAVPCYIYDSVKNTITLGNINDVFEGKRIYVHQYDFYVRDIIIIK